MEPILSEWSMTVFVDQTLPEDSESVQEILPEDLDKISGAMRKLGTFHNNGDLDPFDLLR
jgi:hypothetical protein